MFNVFIYKVWKHQNIWRESVDGGASINVVISLTRQMLNSELNNQNIWRQFKKKKCLLMVKHQLMWSSLTRQMLKSELNNSRLQTTINIYDILFISCCLKATPSGTFLIILGKLFGWHWSWSTFSMYCYISSCCEEYLQTQEISQWTLVYALLFLLIDESFFQCNAQRHVPPLVSIMTLPC